MKAFEWVTYAIETSYARKTVHWRVGNKGRGFQGGDRHDLGLCARKESIGCQWMISER